MAPGWGDFKTIAKFNPDLIRDWVTKNVAQAGTLSTVIGEDKENITKLKLTGNLNDTDVQYLEEMIREAALLELNLKDALLYTINVCRFSDCKSLTSLVLPDVLKRIEKQLFELYRSDNHIVACRIGIYVWCFWGKHWSYFYIC